MCWKSKDVSALNLRSAGDISVDTRDLISKLIVLDPQTIEHFTRERASVVRRGHQMPASMPKLEKRGLKKGNKTVCSHRYVGMSPSQLLIAVLNRDIADPLPDP